MDFSRDQIEELKDLFPGVQRCDEGNLTYFLLPNVALPEGCVPGRTDLLLCPMFRDGYPSRLFFAERVSTPANLNWNNNSYRILERNWQAYSWMANQEDQNNLRLAQMVALHMGGLR